MAMHNFCLYGHNIASCAEMPDRILQGCDDTRR
jgi:hypothetical protein